MVFGGWMVVFWVVVECLVRNLLIGLNKELLIWWVVVGGLVGGGSLFFFVWLCVCF